MRKYIIACSLSLVFNIFMNSIENTGPNQEVKEERIDYNEIYYDLFDMITSQKYDDIYISDDDVIVQIGKYKIWISNTIFDIKFDDTDVCRIVNDDNYKLLLKLLANKGS